MASLTLIPSGDTLVVAGPSKGGPLQPRGSHLAVADRSPLGSQRWIITRRGFCLGCQKVFETEMHRTGATAQEDRRAHSMEDLAGRPRARG
ncbi:hypothetical protein WJX84_001372 [Apatococcus fuscideae]|uniref:Uncharacterized protein n=1 Tax=Apatococcus fuscideae TaxID=2026836 RepID=A0AAW1TER6_9CHLO